jgi:hypothetical protein
MRNVETVIATPEGDLRVRVTAEALERLRPGAGVFNDPASILRTYRSVIAEIAVEKALDASLGSGGMVTIDADDVG